MNNEPITLREIVFQVRRRIIESVEIMCETDLLIILYVQGDYDKDCTMMNSVKEKVSTADDVDDDDMVILRFVEITLG